jgi:hypothetical protein
MIDDGFEIKFLPGTPPQEVGCPPLSPRTERVDGMIIEYDTAVRMRDGIEIYADVFRPDSPELVPPIIGWGPYGKHGAVKYDIFPKHGVDPAWTSKYAGFEAPDPLYWTRHGYAVINVDLILSWVAAPASRSSCSTTSRRPTSVTAMPCSFTARSAPRTISVGARSPPIASTAIGSGIRRRGCARS